MGRTLQARAGGAGDVVKGWIFRDAAWRRNILVVAPGFREAVDAYFARFSSLPPQRVEEVEADSVLVVEATGEGGES